MEAIRANEWSHASTLIHLRASLTEEAMDCGRADSVESIYETLKVCFGMTSQEARPSWSPCGETLSNHYTHMLRKSLS